MHGAQHRAGNIVSINLITGHQQPSGPLGWGVLLLGEPAIGAHQTIVTVVMGFAAGTMHKPVMPRGNHKGGISGAVIT